MVFIIIIIQWLAHYDAINNKVYDNVWLVNYEGKIVILLYYLMNANRSSFNS